MATHAENLKRTVDWIDDHDAWEDVAGIPTCSTIHFREVADLRLYLAGKEASVKHEPGADHYEVYHDGMRFTACELVGGRTETVQLG